MHESRPKEKPEIDLKEEDLDILIADNLFLRSLGLMGRKLNKDQVMLFKFDTITNQNFHTFLMRQNIDMVFLNKEQEVIDLKKDVRRCNVISPIQGYRYVIEGNSGFIDEVGIRRNIKVEWGSGNELPED